MSETAVNLQEHVPVRRGRAPHTRIENAIADDSRVTLHDLAVYFALAYYSNSRTAECWPAYDTIGKMARCARAIVAKSLKHLEELGYIQITRSHKANGTQAVNVYFLPALTISVRPLSSNAKQPSSAGELGGMPAEFTGKTSPSSPGELEPILEENLGTAAAAPEKGGAAVPGESQLFEPDYVVDIPARLRAEAAAGSEAASWALTQLERNVPPELVEKVRKQPANYAELLPQRAQRQCEEARRLGEHCPDDEPTAAMSSPPLQAEALEIF